MENLSLDGLTPEQISELKITIENFKRQNELTKENENLEKKFYRIEAIIYGPDGPLLDFIARANSFDPDSLEFIVDEYGNTSENMCEYIYNKEASEITNIIEEINEWLDQFWYSDFVCDDSFDFEMEFVEITEEEYNNAEDKWKDAKIKRGKIVY